MNNINLIQNKLNLASSNLKLISDNIANVNTPNFKRKYIDVQSNDLTSAFNIELKKVNDKHLDSAGISDPSLKEVQSSIRTDNNGVDVNTEVMELNKSSLFNNSLIRLLNIDFTNSKTIINSK